MLEFGYESDLTVYRIEEYGKTIIKDDALKVISEQFS
jgi:adapter protein MecA 1/2